MDRRWHQLRLAAVLLIVAAPAHAYDPWQGAPLFIGAGVLFGLFGGFVTAIREYRTWKGLLASLAAFTAAIAIFMLIVASSSSVKSPVNLEAVLLFTLFFAIIGSIPLLVTYFFVWRVVRLRSRKVRGR